MHPSSTNFWQLTKHSRFNNNIATKSEGFTDNSQDYGNWMLIGVQHSGGGMDYDISLVMQWNDKRNYFLAM